MNKLKLAAGVLLVFLAGALAGSLGTMTYFKQLMGRFPPGGPPPKAMTTMMMKRLSGELDLTDAQHAEVRKIVASLQEDVLSLRRKTQPEMEALNDASFASIRDLLDDKQKQKLDALHRRISGLHDREAVHLALSERRMDHLFSEMKDSLKLTPEQAESMRNILRDNSRERRELSEAFRGKDHPEARGIRRKIRKLRATTDKRLSEILTDEQMEQYRELQRGKRGRMRPGMHPGRHGGRSAPRVSAIDGR